MCRDCDRSGSLAAAYRRKRGGATLARCRSDDLGADFVIRSALVVPKAKTARAAKSAVAKSRLGKAVSRKPARSDRGAR